MIWKILSAHPWICGIALAALAVVAIFAWALAVTSEMMDERFWDGRDE